MILDTEFDQAKARVAKIMAELGLAGTLERNVSDGSSPRIIVRMIGSQSLVDQFTLKMEKLSKHHGNYGVHLDATSKCVNDIFDDNSRDEKHIYRNLDDFTDVFPAETSLSSMSSM